ncbi:DUF3418 domain-containing protein [Limnohabitans sp.]|uniref:DUF3418 domain-containing protein n=1 Tax=Limnohabitans sp. TaxID=1907725 RepID=UPI00345924FB
MAERKGAQDARMLEFRWLLEELRVSFFAQELAHSPARQHQAAGEGLGAVESLSWALNCLLYVN